MNRTRQVTKYANEDTPSKIQVPDNIYGLSLWAFGRFGMAVVFAGAAYLFYQDQRADQQINRNIVEKMMSIREDDLRSREEDRRAIQNLTSVVQRLSEIVDKQSKN